jgi:ABC-type branched-subunit amino acid transport system substrate-binding protein
MSRRASFAVVCVLALSMTGAKAAPPLPAPGPPAVRPDGAPTISIGISIDDDDRYGYTLVADAFDPDGYIKGIDLCPGTGDECAIERFATAGAGPVERARVCLEGDTRSLSMHVRFPAAGRYTVTARALGAGCKPLTKGHSTSTQREVEVVDPPTPLHIECADAGTPMASAPGVTADTVSLAMVATLSGPLGRGAAVNAVERVIHAVNDGGGVCGRQLALRVVDDGGDASRSLGFTRSFMQFDEVFGMVSMPSRAWQGVIESGEIDQAAIPVVGTLGSVPVEFQSPWVWPVGNAPHVFADLVVRHAYDRAARSFALVRDGTPSAANVAARMAEDLAAREGTTFHDVQLPAGRASYSAEIQNFNGLCDGQCDAVVYALDSGTALTWEAGKPRHPSIELSMWPGLFDSSFFSNCGAACHEALVWTDFQPPIGATSEGVRAYRSAVFPSDGLDRAAEGAYQGALLMARALGRAGTALTREGLRDALDSGSYFDGLTADALAWTASSHQANRWERAYSIVVAQGSFAGLRVETDWLEAS